MSAPPSDRTDELLAALHTHAGLLSAMHGALERIGVHLDRHNDLPELTQVLTLTANQPIALHRAGRRYIRIFNPGSSLATTLQIPGAGPVSYSLPAAWSTLNVPDGTTILGPAGSNNILVSLLDWNPADEGAAAAASSTTIAGPLGQKAMAASVSTVIASDQTDVPTNLDKVGGAAVALGSHAGAASVPAVIASDQGAVAIGAASGTPLTNVQSNSQLPVAMRVKKTVDGDTVLALGQATMANAVPVVIASDQSTFSVNTAAAADVVANLTGMTALNAATQIVLSGTNTVGLLLSGTWVGTITPEISVDGGATWLATQFYRPDTQTFVATVTANGTFALIGTAGASHARVRLSAYTSGTVAGNLRAVSQAPDALTAQIGSAVIQAVSGTALAADQTNSELRTSLYVKKTVAGDTALALGQATMANSLPIALASDQPAISVSSAAPINPTPSGATWREGFLSTTSAATQQFSKFTLAAGGGVYNGPANGKTLYISQLIVSVVDKLASFAQNQWLVDVYDNNALATYYRFVVTATAGPVVINFPIPIQVAYVASIAFGLSVYSPQAADTTSLIYASFAGYEG